jgi:hypothetical protein
MLSKATVNGFPNPTALALVASAEYVRALQHHDMIFRLNDDRAKKLGQVIETASSGLVGRDSETKKAFLEPLETQVRDCKNILADLTLHLLSQAFEQLNN